MSNGKVAGHMELLSFHEGVDPWKSDIREVLIEQARDYMTHFKCEDRTVTLYLGNRLAEDGKELIVFGYVHGVNIPKGFKKLTIEVLEIKPYGNGFKWEDFR